MRRNWLIKSSWTHGAFSRPHCPGAAVICRDGAADRMGQTNRITNKMAAIGARSTTPQVQLPTTSALITCNEFLLWTPTVTCEFHVNVFFPAFSTSPRTFATSVGKLIAPKAKVVKSKPQPNKTFQTPADSDLTQGTHDHQPIGIVGLRTEGK